MVSWLVRSTPEQEVQVRALARDIVLCSWARHFTLTVPLSTQVYKWVPANCWGKPNKLWGSDLRWTSIPSRGSRNTSCRFMPQKSGYEPVLTARLHFFFNAYTYLMFGNYCWIQGMRTLAGLMAFFLVEQEADLFRQYLNSTLCLMFCNENGNTIFLQFLTHDLGKTVSIAS